MAWVLGMALNLAEQSEWYLEVIVLLLEAVIVLLQLADRLVLVCIGRLKRLSKLGQLRLQGCFLCPVRLDEILSIRLHHTRRHCW